MNHDMTELQRNRLEALAEEYVRRKRRGEAVAIDEYVDQYPELASEIRELFPVVAMLDQAAPTTDKESPEVIEPGVQLGEYQLLRVIGRGGMGVVYQAEHIALGSIAAIKVLPASRSGAKGRERFQREASAAARMHHPNIVRVFDFGCHGNSLYYVMPFIEGWGLDRLIGNHAENAEQSGIDPKDNPSKPPTKIDLAATMSWSDAKLLDQAKEADGETRADLKDRTRHLSGGDFRTDDLWNWVAKLGIQAADALDSAHSIGIVHRDVKPSNLMIDADNHLYVTDFGLAKIVDEHSLTGTGDLLGTFRYMPPEAFAGRADQRSDIYGLGLTLYELLADRPAFAERERGQLLTAITDGRVAPLQTLAQGIPRDLQTVIHKAINVDPAARYQTASDFRDDLARFVSGEPIQARRSTWAYRTSRWISRNRAVSVLTSIAMITLVVGLIVSSMGWSRALTAEADANELAKKEKLARKFAESESAAKEQALRQKEKALTEKDLALVAKQAALEAKERQRVTEKAISDYLLNDLLPLTTVEGQNQWRAESLNKASTLLDLLNRAAHKLNSRKDLDPIVEAELARVIGLSYRHIGKHKLAVPLLERSAELRESELEPGDPHFLNTLNSLAVGYSAAGQLRQAEDVFLRILHANPRELDPRYTLNYAEVLRKLGKADKAIPLAEAALAQSQLDLHKNDRVAAQAMYVLGDLLLVENRLERAIPLLKESIRLYQVSSSNPENPSAVRSMRALSQALQAAGKDIESIRLIEQVYEITKRTRNENEAEYGFVLNQLANTYRLSGNAKKALPFHRAAVSKLNAILSPGHGDSVQAGMNLGLCLYAVGDYRGCAEQLQSLLEYLPKVQSNPFLQYSVRHNLGFVWRKCGELDKSIEMLTESIEHCTRLHSETHQQAMKTMSTLSHVYAQAGRLEEALATAEKLLKLTRATNGEDDPLTQQAMSDVKQYQRELAKQ